MDPVNVPADLEVRSPTRTRDNTAYVKTWGTSWIRPSRSPNVTDFGTNRKRILLVRNSNLGPISHRCGDIARFLSRRVTRPLFNPNFGGVAVAPDGPRWVLPRAKALSYSAVVIFEVFQPV